MDFKQFMNQHRSTITKISAAAVALQGLYMAKLILQTERLEDQAVFLASLVNKNMDRLEDFDFIALRELGLIKETAE